MTPAAGRCPNCRHAVGWLRRGVEGWVCARGYAFVAIAGGAQLPSRLELRRADLAEGETCGEWAAR